MPRSLALALVGIAACSHTSPDTAPPIQPPPPPADRPVTLTVIGTNDLHGALERLPLLAGFVADVRAARAADGGGVVLVDGGDLFQGTLESNLGEGVDVIRAYNRIGYSASAIGNHEFDYGPIGPAVTAKGDEDPRGALKARISEAKFPFLAANVVDDATGQPIAWPNAAPSTLLTVAGVKVGIIGISTVATPTTTMPANVIGLHFPPGADAIAREAHTLRDRGAQIVVVTAHLGSECSDLDHPDAVESCDHKTELFPLLDALPKGLVDVFVAGHTHAGVAHRIDGVAVIESFSSGRAFGRVDLRVEHGKVTDVKIFPPQLLCPVDAHRNAIPVADCHPQPYEGKPVVADRDVQTIIDEALARASSKRSEELGVTLAGPVTKEYKSESVEGDLLTDWMLAARPDADLALTNGGGLRADIPAGPVTYGELYQAIPFDNRFALVTLQGKDVRELIAKNLGRDNGILSWSGLAAKARCDHDALAVDVTVKGKPLDPNARYTIVTSDFLASGGDGGMFAAFHLTGDAIKVTDTIIREAVADVLRGKKGATIDPTTVAMHRLSYTGRRPVRCGAQPAAPHAEHDE